MMCPHIALSLRTCTLMACYCPLHLQQPSLPYESKVGTARMASPHEVLLCVDGQHECGADVSSAESDLHCRVCQVDLQKSRFCEQLWCT